MAIALFFVVLRSWPVCETNPSQILEGDLLSIEIRQAPSRRILINPMKSELLILSWAGRIPYYIGPQPLAPKYLLLPRGGSKLTKYQGVLIYGKGHAICLRLRDVFL